MDIMIDQLVPARTVRTVAVDDSVVLVDQTSGQYFGLNEVGGEMWRLLEEGRPGTDIVTAIASQFDAPQDVIATDTQRLLTELLRAGLLTVAA